MRASTQSHITLGDRIITTIRDAIIDGELPAGSRLVNNDHARQFDASRPASLEAFRHLEIEGMVVNFPIAAIWSLSYAHLTCSSYWNYEDCSREEHYRFYAERFRAKAGDREDFVLHVRP